jgi:hypothetical protein
LKVSILKRVVKLIKKRRQIHKNSYNFGQNYLYGIKAVEWVYTCCLFCLVWGVLYIDKKGLVGLTAMQLGSSALYLQPFF